VVAAVHDDAGVGIRIESGGATVTAWTATDLVGVRGMAGLIGRCFGEPESLAEALSLAVQRLQAAGASRILAPMDGSTWASYRVIVDDASPDELPFSGEPEGSLLPALANAGFQPGAFYQSRIADLPAQRPGRDRLARRLAGNGISVRLVQPDLRSLSAVFDLASRAFARNAFYRPISLEAFCQRQRAGSQRRALWLAQGAAGNVAGFAYAYEDGTDPTRMILKTWATDPGLRHTGLGAHLADEAHEWAFAQGYRRAIHALMHEDNASLNLSRRFESRLLRRYALFEWRPPIR
jgi:L-amino acid N-acyltransferase YncA